jgi:hypothetical protein
MRVLTRSLAALGLAALAGTTSLGAQDAAGGVGAFRFYLGGQAGALVFETAAQNSGGVPLVGGHALITAKRAALLLQVDAGLGNNELAAYSDPTELDGVRTVSFDRIMRYQAVLMAYPLKSHVQPFVGLGFGIMTLHSTEIEGTFVDAAAEAEAEEIVEELGSTGFASFTAGLEFRVGRLNAFGQYLVTTAPADGRLIVGATHTLAGGLRFSIGKANEGFE